MAVLDIGIAQGLLDGLALMLLTSAVWSVLVRRLENSIRLLAVQGVLLAAATAVVALTSGTGHAYLAVVLTIAAKVVVVPGILLYALREVKVKREVEVVVSGRVALLLAVGLVLVAYSVSGPLSTDGGFLTHNALPAALSGLLIGLLNMLIRKKAINQIIGLVAMENGLYLMAVVATQGLPLAVELGVAIDLVIGVLVMGLFARWIHRAFDTINTDYLGTLRG